MKKRNTLSLLLIATIIAVITSMSVGVYASAEVESVTFTGRWTDNYDFKFTLIAFGGRIRGFVKTVEYGTWIISGTYTGSSFEFTATNPPPIEVGAAEWFTYTGTHTLTSASGTWVNSAALSGSFTMTRGW